MLTKMCDNKYKYENMFQRIILMNVNMLNRITYIQAAFVESVAPFG